VTVQARRNHVTTVRRSEDPRMRPYYWIDEGQSDWEPHDRSDYQAVRDGFISITPLQTDLTNHGALDYIEGLAPHLAAVE
jgi:5'-nucleotidase